MAAIIPAMVDPKATGTVLYQLFIPPPGTEPLSFFTWLNTKALLISSRIRNVLYLFTEVIVIGGWSNRISTQCIHVRVPESRLMYYLEAEILQHVHPPSSSAMCIRHNSQPFKRLVVYAQDEVIPVQILHEVHDAPN
jgi:hypothetical protein